MPQPHFNKQTITTVFQKEFTQSLIRIIRYHKSLIGKVGCAKIRPIRMAMARDAPLFVFYDDE
jgi:hypothetical protein